MVDRFPAPAPGAQSITLRPWSVRRAEEAAAGVSWLKPRWEAFQDLLRRSREALRAKCPLCARASEKSREVA